VNRSGPTSPTKRVLPAAEAAQYLGYAAPTAAFYAYTRVIGVSPLPERKGAYDRIAIDAALDRASGFEAQTDFGTVSYGNASVR